MDFADFPVCGRFRPCQNVHHACPLPLAHPPGDEDGISLILLLNDAVGGPRRGHPVGENDYQPDVWPDQIQGGVGQLLPQCLELIAASGNPFRHR